MGRAPEKLNRMKRRHSRNDWYVKHKVKCYCCGSEDYKLYSCERFLELELVSRLDLVTRVCLCTNCLSREDFDFVCLSSDCCRVCNRRHHTLLHEPCKYCLSCS